MFIRWTILSLLTNKIIGILKDYINRKGNNKNNIGTYLKYPLNDLSPFHNTISEIKLDIEIKKEDIKKDIYFLDNSDGHIDYKGKKNHSDNLKELNELNTELYINNKKYKYKKYFIPEKEGIYSILLKINNISIKDCSFMLYNCKKIINIDPFYNDICFHYTSKYNKDVPLKDRALIYYPVISLCDEECE